MKNNNQNGKILNRVWIIVNYLTLVLLILLVMFASYHKWHPYVIPIGIISLSLFLWSFLKIYWFSMIWRKVHTSLRKLEEPERGFMARIKNTSYQVFTIMTILVLLIFSLLEVKIHIVIVAAWLYWAHILPATLYIWIGSDKMQTSERK